MHKPHALNLRMADNNKIRVLTPDASEFTQVAKTIPAIIEAVKAWREYVLEKLITILLRYSDYETIKAIQVSIYNTARMIFGMHGT